MLIGIALLLCSVTQALTLNKCAYEFGECLYDPKSCRTYQAHTYATCQKWLDNFRFICLIGGLPKNHCEEFDLNKCLTKEVSASLLGGGFRSKVYCYEETGVPTALPTENQSSRPSEDPTAVPTMQPTEDPSSRPSQAPTEHASAPTDSPTEQDTGEVCDAVREWTKETADSNCVASSFPSKNFGIRACKSRFQMKLEMNLANKLYTSCGSRCVYDYNSLMANGKEAFLYRRGKKCYKRVTKGGCFKMSYGVVMGRAKKLCSY